MGRQEKKQAKVGGRMGKHERREKGGEMKENGELVGENCEANEIKVVSRGLVFGGGWKHTPPPTQTKRGGRKGGVKKGRG